MARTKDDALARWRSLSSLRDATLARCPELRERFERQHTDKQRLAQRRAALETQQSDPDYDLRAEARDALQYELLPAERRHAREEAAVIKALREEDEHTKATADIEMLPAQIAAAEELRAALAAAVVANERLRQIDDVRRRILGGVFGVDALAWPSLSPESLAEFEQRIARRRARLEDVHATA